MISAPPRKISAAHNNLLFMKTVVFTKTTVTVFEILLPENNYGQLCFLV